MVSYRADITVERPAADVFPFLADISVFPQWMGGTSTEPISPGPMAVGYRYRYQTDEGLMEIDGKRHVVRRHDVIFLPPGIEHSIANTGLVDLVFLVVTSPVSDDTKD